MNAKHTSLMRLRYSPLMTSSWPGFTGLGCMLSMLMGSRNESIDLVSMVPLAWCRVTVPGCAVWGTVTRISLGLITWMSVMSSQPGMLTFVILSRPLPRKRSSPPRATGDGPKALRLMPPLYCSVLYLSSSSHDVSAGSTTSMQSASRPYMLKNFFI